MSARGRVFDNEVFVRLTHFLDYKMVCITQALYVWLLQLPKISSLLSFQTLKDDVYKKILKRIQQDILSLKLLLKFQKTLCKK